MSEAATAPGGHDSPSPRSWNLTPDDELLLEAADRFSREVLHPLCRRMDDEEWWPGHVFPELGKLGFLGMTVPESYGGAGLDLFASGLVCQAMARWNHAFALSWGAHENLCLNNIWRNGSEHLRRKYLPGLCDGSLVGALALTEPGAGSDALGSMRLRAHRDGAHYVLNGTKLYITNGPVADVLLVYAKTAPERGAKGISAFVVESGFPGFRVAQRLTKMGFRGSPTGELVFEDCRVPAENLVGEENEGHRVVMSGLDLERAIITPICLGIAERVLELALAHASMREQFGRPIGSFQMVQERLARMYVGVETLRTFNYRTLATVNDLPPGEGGRGPVHRLTAASILHGGEVLNRILDDGVQIHGGAGYIWESEMNRLYRANKLLEIGAGTNEVRRLIIAEELLKEAGMGP